MAHKSGDTNESQSRQRAQFERLRSLAERDPRLKDALDFAKSGADVGPQDERSSSRKIRRPYVSAPTLPERSRK